MTVSYKTGFVRSRVSRLVALRAASEPGAFSPARNSEMRSIIAGESRTWRECCDEESLSVIHETQWNYDLPGCWIFFWPVPGRWIFLWPVRPEVTVVAE